MRTASKQVGLPHLLQLERDCGVLALVPHTAHRQRENKQKSATVLRAVKELEPQGIVKTKKLEKKKKESQLCSTKAQAEKTLQEAASQKGSWKGSCQSDGSPLSVCE